MFKCWGNTLTISQRDAHHYIISKHISKLELLRKKEEKTTTTKQQQMISAFESKARMKIFPVLFQVSKCMMTTAVECINIFIRQIQSSWWHFPVLTPAYNKCPMTDIFTGPLQFSLIVQELCESRGGRPGLSVLTSLLVSVDVKIYWTVLRHWSQLVPNMSNDIWGH